MSVNSLKIVILDDYQKVALSSTDWSSIRQPGVSIDVFTQHIGNDAALVKVLEPYQIVCCMRERTKFPSTILDQLPNLRLLSTTGMRNRSIDVEHAKSKGIAVCGTDSSGTSTVEHIWALILSTVRHIVEEDSNIKSNAPQWQNVIPLGLHGKTLGLVGVGKLGREVAKIAKVAFGMRVVGWSPHLTPERAEEAAVEFMASKQSLLAESDIVSVHLVLSETTKGLLNASDLSSMKSTAYLINTSRGPIVDEDVLVKILQEGKIRGAGLDVYSTEPLPTNHPIRHLKNVTLSPHNAYVTEDSYATFWRQTVENIEHFLQGRPRRLL